MRRYGKANMVVYKPDGTTVQKPIEVWFHESGAFEVKIVDEEAGALKDYHFIVTQKDLKRIRDTGTPVE